MTGGSNSQLMTGFLIIFNKVMCSGFRTFADSIGKL